ncbi:MAG TPA: methyltransferase [Bacteriovoracaceae bacterium]|nr:methyltransferase [Bacteriovoracaceae bacterium]
MSQDAEVILNSFFKSHLVRMRDYTNVSLEETGLLKSFSGRNLELTHFNDLYDTLIYSDLIYKALTLNPGINQLVDLGAGSSIPTLLALKKANLLTLKTIAVDLDPEAIEVSKRNAEKFGLSDSYTFLQGSMSSVLSDIKLDEHTLLVSNPPYIPVPPGMKEHYLLPVDGGEDGSLYLEEVLRLSLPYGPTLALLWGSLTNPRKIIPLIEEDFDVLHLEAIRIHFGHYTSLPLIKSYLYLLREAGKVVFGHNEDEGESQIVIGTILRPKSHRQ